MRHKFKTLINKGAKTAMIFSKQLRINEILDKENDDYTQIDVLNNTDNQKTIIINTYISPGPDHDSRFSNLLYKLNFVLTRYKDSKLILFGDLNINRKRLVNKLKELQGENKELKAIFDLDEKVFTRYRETVNGIQESYLDYFIINNIKEYTFSINEPIFTSDHKVLKLVIPISELGDLKADTELRLKFKYKTEEVDEISKDLITALNSADKLGNLVNITKKLREKNKPKNKKAFAGYSKKKEIVDLLKICKKKKDRENVNELKKKIKNLSNEEYNNFLSEFEKLKISRNSKEYFLRLRFYSQINKSSEILRNLSCEKDEDGFTEILTDKYAIDEKLQNKYMEAFEDHGYKETYESSIERNLDITGSEVGKALDKLNLKKAISWDLIPGESYVKIINELTRASKLDYQNFMSCFSKLDSINKNKKEFFLKLRFYYKVNQSSELLNNLEELDPAHGMIKTITNRFDMDERIIKKYKHMFRDKGVKVLYPPI